MIIVIVLLQEYLQKTGFLPSGCSKLTGHVGNLNTLFANKKCQETLSKARKFMKEDLYNMTPLKPGTNSSKWASFVAR